MSGLFSRLAQQHINQHTLSIKSAQSPVFAMQINEHNAGVSDVDREQVLPHRHVEPGTKIKNTDTDMNDYSEISVSNSPGRNGSGRNETDVANPKLQASATASLTPVINSAVKVTTAHEVKTPLSIASLLTPEVAPSIQPQLPENSESLQIPFVSDEDKETSFSGIEDINLLPENNSIFKQAFNNHQVLPSSINNRNVRSTQKFVQHVCDENQTTINVSIGQIDIRATQAEKDEKKIPTRSSQTRSSALEEYHQKRVRGER